MRIVFSLTKGSMLEGSPELCDLSRIASRAGRSQMFRSLQAHCWLSKTPRGLPSYDFNDDLDSPGHEFFLQLVMYDTCLQASNGSVSRGELFGDSKKRDLRYSTITVCQSLLRT